MMAAAKAAKHRSDEIDAMELKNFNNKQWFLIGKTPTPTLGSDEKEKEKEKELKMKRLR